MQKYTVEIDNSGNIRWYKFGTSILHREDGPAREYANGDKYWFKDGKCHREDGPAVECATGDKTWYKEDELHREDGPAREYANGNKYWYKEGKCHREDGPAVEYATGDKEYWLNGKRYTEADYLKLTAKTDPCEGKVVEIEGKKYKLVGIDKL